MRTIARLRRATPGRRPEPLGAAMGLAPVTERQRLESAAGKPLTGGADAPPDGGLFDLGARDQIDLEDWLMVDHER